MFGLQGFLNDIHREVLVVLLNQVIQLIVISHNKTGNRKALAFVILVFGERTLSDQTDIGGRFVDGILDIRGV